jgi:predicted nucleotidyltransferase
MDSDASVLESIAARLRQEYGAERVLLFGSAARGEAGPDSDVDLLVVKPTTEEFFHRLGSVQRILRHHRHGLDISPIVLTPAELRARLDKGDHFIQEILATGVDL